MPARKKNKNGDEAPAATGRITFEKAIGEVEEIVQAMDGDRIPLDELLKSYERGNQLLKICRERIAEAQTKIDLITTDASGDLEPVPFDTEEPKKQEPESGENEKERKSDEIRLF